MSLRRWTEVEIAFVVRSFADGVDDAKIASHIGRTAKAVRNLRSNLGLGIIRAPTIRDQTVSEIADLYESGVMPTEISRRTGVTVGAVEYYIRRDGIVSPKSHVQSAIRPIDADLMTLSSRGMSTSEIARRLGVSLSVARSRLTTLARRDAISEERAGL